MGGGIGSAVVGGLGDVLGTSAALLLLTVLPVVDLLALVPALLHLRRTRSGSAAPSPEPTPEPTPAAALAEQPAD